MEAMIEERMVRLLDQVRDAMVGTDLAEVASDEEFIARLCFLKRERDHYRKQYERMQERFEEQVGYANAWHGRYRVVCHENNQLRKKLTKE